MAALVCALNLASLISVMRFFLSDGLHGRCGLDSPDSDDLRDWYC